MAGFTIGEAARSAGVHVETLRYYERKRLIQRPPRTASNYRAYPAETVHRVRFIKRSQELGFSLAEIKELLSLRASPKGRCCDVRARAEAKIGDIEEKMRTLRRMKKALGKLVSECSAEGPVTECPILEALETWEAA